MILILHTLIANFQRDGRAVHDDNQGNRPNYPSTQETLNLPPRAYNDANHTVWVCAVGGVLSCKTNLITCIVEQVGGAVRYLSTVSDIDFDWPRIFVCYISIYFLLSMSDLVNSGMGCQSKTRTTSSATSLGIWDLPHLMSSRRGRLRCLRKLIRL